MSVYFSPLIEDAPSYDTYNWGVFPYPFFSAFVSGVLITPET